MLLEVSGRCLLVVACSVTFAAGADDEVVVVVVAHPRCGIVRC